MLDCPPMKKQSLNHHAAAMGRVGGKSTSPRKVLASRRNAALASIAAKQKRESLRKPGA